jgi:hypothetical protein
MSRIHPCVTVGIVCFLVPQGLELVTRKHRHLPLQRLKRRYLRPRYRLATTPDQLLIPSKTMDKPVRKRGA